MLKGEKGPLANKTPHQTNMREAGFCLVYHEFVVSRIYKEIWM